MKHSIKEINIRSFKGIKETRLDNLRDKAPWIFLTGENGFGKTLILQAISAGLGGMERHLFDIFESSKKPSIRVRLHDDKKSYELPDLSLNVNSKTVLSALACYGSSRLETYSESSSVEKSITGSLFDSSLNLQNYEYQFTRWALKKDDEEFGQKFKNVKSLFVELLELRDIEITRDDEVYYIEKDSEDRAYNKIKLKNLASGYRSILAFIGDLILKLFENQPDINNPKDLHGIVIIDELDLHLHPKWQKKLPTLLSKYFPNIQFIASTHSPIPILGAPKKSVLTRVNRNSEDGITIERLKDEEKKIGNMLPNQILTSPIFGFLELFPESNRNENKIRTEEDYIELKINDYLSKRLGKEKNSVLEGELLNYINKSKRGRR